MHYGSLRHNQWVIPTMHCVPGRYLFRRNEWHDSSYSDNALCLPDLAMPDCQLCWTLRKCYYVCVLAFFSIQWTCWTPLLLQTMLWAVPVGVFDVLRQKWMLRGNSKSYSVLWSFAAANGLLNLELSRWAGHLQPLGWRVPGRNTDEEQSIGNAQRKPAASDRTHINVLLPCFCQENVCMSGDYPVLGSGEKPLWMAK